jgi:hypothetical protein
MGPFEDLCRYAFYIAVAAEKIFPRFPQWDTIPYPTYSSISIDLQRSVVGKQFKEE